MRKKKQNFSDVPVSPLTLNCIWNKPNQTKPNLIIDQGIWNKPNQTKPNLIIDQCRSYFWISRIILMKVFQGYIIFLEREFCLVFILSKNKDFHFRALLEMPSLSPSINGLVIDKNAPKKGRL